MLEDSKPIGEPPRCDGVECPNYRGWRRLGMAPCCRDITDDDPLSPPPTVPVMVPPVAAAAAA